MYICMYPADIPGNVAQVKRTKRDRAQRYNQEYTLLLYEFIIVDVGAALSKFQRDAALRL